MSKNDQSSDSRRAFQDAGIEPFRNIVVIERSKLPALIDELESVLTSE